MHCGLWVVDTVYFTLLSLLISPSPHPISPSPLTPSNLPTTRIHHSPRRRTAPLRPRCLPHHPAVRANPTQDRPTLSLRTPSLIRLIAQSTQWDGIVCDVYQQVILLVLVLNCWCRCRNADRKEIKIVPRPTRARPSVCKEISIRAVTPPVTVSSTLHRNAPQCGCGCGCERGRGCRQSRLGSVAIIFFTGRTHPHKSSLSPHPAWVATQPQPVQPVPYGHCGGKHYSWKRSGWSGERS